MPVTGERPRDRPERWLRPVHPLRVRREISPDSSTLTAWDELVEGAGGTDVTQLSAWASIRAAAGYQPLYLLARQGGTLLGGALVHQRTVGRVLRVGYLPYGPLVAGGPDRAVVTEALVAELHRLSGTLRLTVVQPPEGGEAVSAALLADGFRPSRIGIAPAGSYRLDLARPLEEIRAGFSPRLRSWTNRWAGRGVHVRDGGEADLPLLVSLMRVTAERQHFRPPGLDYLTRLWHGLDARGHVALFVGEVHGQPVSADLVTVLGGMIRGRFGGFDGSGEAGRLSVPAAVRWEIIQWGQRRGHRWLDFGGLPERMLADLLDRGIAHSDQWPSAHTPKISFNGRAFRYPTPVERIRPAALRWTYDRVSERERGATLLDSVKQSLRGGHG
jgi:lipid II:glycine glycyltransferase (peptidoglycan interpeptide bridge formation enzyme)